MDAYRDWLADRHRSMVTPPDLVGTLVRRATGARVTGLDRIVVGQDNEVYDAALDDGRHVIVRISHDDDPRFVAERWAIEAARAVGVPTPHVYLADDAVAVGDRTLGVCVEERLAGRPLDDQELLEQVGHHLGALHTVPVDGFGYLRPDGRAWDVTFADIMTDLTRRPADVDRAAKECGVDPAEAGRGLDLLAGHVAGYAHDRPVLIHGDFGPPHVFVDGGRVTGFIDLQGAAGLHPVADLVHWYAHWDDRLPLRRLLAGYPHPELADGPLFQLVLLRQALWMLVTAAERGNRYGVDIARRDLAAAVRALT